MENQDILSKVPENLKPAIQSIIEREFAKINKVVCTNLLTNGASYMGILYKVFIHGQMTDNSDKEISLFIKNIVENEQMKIYSVPDVFKRESFAYTDIANVFDQLQNEAKIPAEERFKMAQCYKECNPRSIILEDLVKSGFTVYHRMETIPLDYAIMCTKELAKFHSLSFVIQNKMPNYFNEKIEPLKQPFNFGKEWYEYVKNIYNYSINCLEEDVKNRVKDIIYEKTNDYPKYMTEMTKRTLCHGDFKHNNVMAKVINEKLEDVVTIDFQIMHYGNPILDFLYFIFNGTDQDFRKQHLTYLKDLYFNTIKSFLQYFEIDIENVFPKAEFERLYKERLDFGLIINVFYVPFLFAAEDDAPDVTQELSNLTFKVDQRFTKRFRGIVDDFINWGYL